MATHSSSPTHSNMRSYMMVSFSGRMPKMVKPNTETLYMRGHSIFFKEENGVAKVVVTTEREYSDLDNKIGELIERFRDTKRLVDDITNPSRELNANDFHHFSEVTRNHHKACASKLLKNQKLQCTRFKETAKNSFELRPNTETTVILDESDELICGYHRITGPAVMIPNTTKTVSETNFEMNISSCGSCREGLPENFVNLVHKSSSYNCRLCMPNSDNDLVDY